MCGIFGLLIAPDSLPDPRVLRRWVDKLFVLSETRGREAAGLAIRADDMIGIYRRAMPASSLIREAGYRTLFDRLAEPRRKQPSPGGASGPLAARSTLAEPPTVSCTVGRQRRWAAGHSGGVSLFGHSRLVTNGSQAVAGNNQPVARDGIVAIHNGIIVNDAALWRRHDQMVREQEIDTEVFVALLAEHRRSGRDLVAAIAATFAEIEGSASVAAMFEDVDQMLLATNCGSLYLLDCGPVRAFASERWIVEDFAGAFGLAGTVEQLDAGGGVIFSPGGPKVAFRFAQPSLPPPPPAAPAIARITNLVCEDASSADLRRCTRCILPETMPFISFDDDGVCNFCRHQQPITVKGADALKAKIAPFRRTDGRAECLVAVSGGRDSCYGLHLIRAELGLKPIAYTYDWGLVTDLARRNQARLCGKLGVEHVVVSADIRRKRDNVRRNIEAWLHRPRLGMIPLWMAGDKQYFLYADQVRRRNGLDLSFLCENRFERGHFKAGFCGIDEGTGGRATDIALRRKLAMAYYYGVNYLKNPRYLNRSVLDTIGGFHSFYLRPHGHHLQLFEYLPWDEATLVDTLVSEYDWELATDTASTWRIGDGTAAFYNYIYYTVAGFTENDTFRSNQIRQGLISRETALRVAAEENLPRWDSMKWYAEVIGFDLVHALQVINGMPKLYGRQA